MLRTHADGREAIVVSWKDATKTHGSPRTSSFFTDWPTSAQLQSFLRAKCRSTWSRPRSGSERTPADSKRQGRRRALPAPEDLFRSRLLVRRCTHPGGELLAEFGVRFLVSAGWHAENFSNWGTLAARDEVTSRIRET